MQRRVGGVFVLGPVDGHQQHPVLESLEAQPRISAEPVVVHGRSLIVM